MAQAEVIQGLLQRGIPPHIAAGIAGNIAVESRFDPGINEISPLVPGSRGGFGLFQHTGPRRRALEAFAQQRGVPVNDLNTQLDFALHELQTTEKAAGEALFKAQTPEEAARVFSEKFLRPGIPHLDRRISAARSIFGGGGDAGLLGGETTPQGGRDNMANGLGGLLGGGRQSGQPGGIRAEGGLLGEGGLLSPDRRDRLILALQGMTLNPNQGLQQAALQGIQGRQQQRQTREQANRTAEFLRQRGRDDLAGAVESGAIPAQAAVQAALAPPEDTSTALQKNFQFFKSLGMSDEEALGAVRSGTTVNIEGQPQVGTIPPGFQLTKDPESGALRMEPIPGGPAAQQQQEAAQADVKRQEQGEIKRSVVSDQVDRALGLMEKKGALDILPEAGIVGGALAGLGINQEAVDLQNTLASIQSAVAFDTLQKMREASKTGGALGAVSERELDLLISAYGGLQQSSSPEMLRRNLETVKRIMGKIESDPVASSFLSGGGQTGGQATAPAATPSQPQAQGGFVVRGRID